MYQEAGCEVHGVDVSPTMVELAREKLGPDAVLQVAEASEIPYDDGSFDLVLATYVCHELASDSHEQVIDECRRVVKDSGRIVVADFRDVPSLFVKPQLKKASILLSKILMGPYDNFRQYLERGGLSALIDRLPLHVYHDYTDPRHHTSMAALGSRDHWRSMVADFRDATLRHAMPVPSRVNQAEAGQTEPSRAQIG
jgi:SAM-dependent methyltransferase